MDNLNFDIPMPPLLEYRHNEAGDVVVSQVHGAIDEELRESNIQSLNTLNILKGKLHNIKDEVLRNLSTAETTQNNRVKTETITNAESVLLILNELNGLITNIGSNSHGDQDVMRSVGALNNEYSELHLDITNRINSLRAQLLGGQRSKNKKRRFKSIKSNKSKGRKRTSRRRRISRKRSKKC
jgi:hypothetical protein